MCARVWSREVASVGSGRVVFGTSRLERGEEEEGDEEEEEEETVSVSIDFLRVCVTFVFAGECGANLGHSSAVCFGCAYFVHNFK